MGAEVNKPKNNSYLGIALIIFTLYNQKRKYYFLLFRFSYIWKEFLQGLSKIIR
ncbi:hypothetical protein D3C73_1345090 [compost metagenome]